MCIIFEHFFHIRPEFSILISCSIIIIYTVLGGVKSLIFNEIFKTIVLCLILPLVYILHLKGVNEIKAIVDFISTSYHTFDVADINFIISFSLFSLFPSIYPPFIQRCLVSSNNPKQLVRSLNVAGIISYPFYIALCLIAYQMKVNNLLSNSEYVMLEFIELLSPYLAIIMISSLILVAISMAEAEINAISVILTNDIFKTVLPILNHKQQLMLVRIIAIALPAFTWILVNLEADLISIAWFITNFWEPMVGIPIIAGFLGIKINNKSFITGIIVAIIFIVSSRIVVGEFAITSWCFGIVGSTLGLLGMHYHQIKQSKAANHYF